jgi:putative cell wall-binding protein
MRRKLRKPLAILLAFAMVFCVAPNIGFAADNDANSVERVSGHDRYETAANIAEYAFPNGADAVVIANGEPALGYADALAGSFLAGAAEAPILLTQANVLPDATAEAIETLNATRAYVLGGELAVSDAVYSELEALGLEVERVWGQNRYATAVKVYETGAELVGTVNTALIANATRPSDALAAGAYANEANVPVLLVDQDSIHPATEAALAGIENTFVIGGNLVVSDEVVSELDATRVSGRTRNATSVAVAETLWESPENFVLVNGADGIVDALAGSVLGMPILYVPSDDVDAYLDKVITANSRGLILGGVNRISDEFLNEIQQKIEGVEEELQVVSVSAINANTILVTFEGMEPVEITLETPLVHGQTEVTFVYEEVEYTGILDEAYADPEVVEEEIAEAVDAAIAKINAIDNPATLTLEDEAKVVAARTAVDAAIELGAVDADIVNLDHLIAAEAKIKSLKDELDAKETAIQDANVALTNLPLAANITLEDKEQVEAARVLVDEAFNLGAEESDLINLWKLTDAEAKIAELEGEATDAEAVQAVEDAIAALPVEAELTLADKDAVVAARAAYDALTEAQQALVPNVNVLEAAEAKITALEEAAAKEITVKSVSAITKTYVDVTFEAVADAMEGVTIEVKDNTGAVVEVKPVNLVKGETVATFTFTKALTEDPEGVWNVAGVKVDLDLKANLAAVYNATTQVKLLEGLNKLALTDVKADNIAFYEAELAKVTDSTKDTYVELEKFTKEVAQKVVTDGNAEALKAVDEEAIVKAVNEAKTQVALLEALAPFERVNADWIADYDGVLGTAETSIKGIQTKIDGANALRVNPKVTALDLDNQAAGASIVKKDLNEAKALVTAYQKPDGEGETAKAETLRKIDRQLAIVTVLEAETPAQLSVAINALKAVDAAYELNMDNYKDANRAAYITALDATSGTNHPFNTITKINAELVAVNDAQAVSAPTAIKTAGTAITNLAAVTDAQKANLLKALKAYTDVKYVADANAAEYAKLPDTTTPAKNAFGEITIVGQTPAQIKAAVQALVDKANLAAIQSATTADEVYAALVAYGNDIKDLSVNNKAQYLTDKANYVTDATTVQSAVDASNIAALQAQTTADGVLAKLAIMTQVKNVKAENAKAYLDSVKDTTSGLGQTTVTTINGVQTLIDAINTAEAANVGVKAVNEATTATELRDILTELVVDGDITAASYLNLTNADKLLVAELFLDDDVFVAGTGLANTARTNLDANKEYQALADIGTDLAALATNFDALRSGMNTVFAAPATPANPPTIAAVQAELANLVKANYTAYDELTGTQKLAVTEAFIAAFPTNADGDAYLGGYSTVTAYFAAVDAAIEAAGL